MRGYVRSANLEDFAPNASRITQQVETRLAQLLCAHYGRPCDRCRILVRAQVKPVLSALWHAAGFPMHAGPKREAALLKMGEAVDVLLGIPLLNANGTPRG